MLYVTDASGDELWRSTVAEPTATSHFEEVLDFPSGLSSPQGITSHVDRLYVVDIGSERAVAFDGSRPDRHSAL